VSVRDLFASALIILAIVAGMMLIVEGRVDMSTLFRTSAIAFGVVLVFRATQRKRSQS
jgi:hypothetical protein